MYFLNTITTLHCCIWAPQHFLGAWREQFVPIFTDEESLGKGK